MQYALVAGGSKGIGYAIAEELAKRGYNLILIARHSDSLLAAKNTLQFLHKIHVETLLLDLGSKNAAEEISQWCTEKKFHSVYFAMQQDQAVLKIIYHYHQMHFVK